MDAESVYVMVLTTTATMADAQRIAESLVTQRLVACAQISPPILSFYQWQGKMERTQEFRICCKTRRERLEEVFDGIRLLHPYQTPQLVAVPITNGSDRYLQWVDDAVRSPVM